MMLNEAAAGASRKGGLRPVWRAVLASALVLGMSAYAAVTLAGGFARHYWAADIVSHFRMHLLVGGLALMIVTWLAGFRRASLAPLLFAAVHASWLVWPLPAPATTLADGSSLRVTTFNVLYWNPGYERTRAYLRELRPDILVLQEMGPGWWDAIRELAEILPYSTTELPRGRRDVAILSRFPIRRYEVIELRGPRGRRIGVTPVRVELDTPTGPVIVYGVHPPHPMSFRQWRDRNQHNAWIAARVAAETSGAPIVVAGDFNQTPWNAYWDELLRRSGLKDAAGTRLQMPTRAPFEPVTWYWLGIPIDHVLVSPEIAVERYLVGPDLGSDHRPVTADLLLPGLPPS
jgi:endonuclease/exonuclease/phosphatase (EEP) superfamily protein YafD